MLICNGFSIISDLIFNTVNNDRNERKQKWETFHVNYIPHSTSTISLIFALAETGECLNFPM